MMLSFALNYLSKGYSVIPLRPKSKEPLIPWTEFQKRRASESEIRGWFLKQPDANLGVVTGYISGIAVVDLDGPEGIEQSKSLMLSSTIISLTGNGKHLWYRLPDGQSIANSVRKYPGIDIRGEGGYIVVPGSIHESGRRYRFLGNVKAATSLPPFPTAIFAPSVSTDVKRNESGWISQALEEMKIGNIDDTLFRICGRLRNDGYSQQDCLRLLEPHALGAGATEGHLEDKIRNVWGRYEPKTIVSQSSNSLVLHSPTNPDSLIEYDRRQCDSDVWLQTGYVKFDTLTKGLKPGELLTVAARTGIGKSNFIIGPARTFCEANKKVLLFSTEMSFDQIWGRYKATLKNPQDFETHQFFICDEFTPNPEKIEDAMRQCNPDLIIFDHVNHVGTDYHEISKFMMSLKELVRRFNIPGIVTAQLSRSADWVENGERITPRLSMIKGSGAIEEISAQVLLLSEKRVHEDQTEIEGIVDKNRHGDKGMIMFALKKNPWRIEEL